MPTLSFGEYRPDVIDLDGATSRSILNVYPRGDGYGPIGLVEAFSDALGAACRGYFFARNNDDTVTIFAGTSTKLYRLNNSDFSWTDVSAGGGSYSALASSAMWSFAQFGDLVIACQANDDVQSYDLTSSSEFADLGGTPPRAAYVSVVNGFVVLSGLAAEPYRIHWSALNDATGWTAGTNSSDYQDLPDGGLVRPVLGGEFGIILQDGAIRRMTFSPGSEAVFDIQRIGKDIGVLAPYSACNAGDRAFFLTPKGFMETNASGALIPIGEEKVNRTFFADYDSSQLQLVIGAADPKAHTVMWVYKSNDNSNNTFDKGLVYNYVLQRWAPIEIEGEYLASLAAPGLTMESLDEVAPGGATISGAADNGSGLVRLTVTSTSGWTTGDYKTVASVGGTTEANGTWAITVINGTTIDLQGSTFANAYTSGGYVAGSLDDLMFSLDAVSTGALPSLSICNTSHQIGFFSGEPMEATLETPEQSADGQRLLVRGFYPITDADDVRGCVSKRENLNDLITYTSEVTMNARGFVPTIRNTRYSRAKIRIPEGTSWTYASGVKPDAMAQGRN